MSESRAAEPTRILIRNVVAERLLLTPLPYGRTRSVGDEPRCVEMIDVDALLYKLCRSGTLANQASGKSRRQHADGTDYNLYCDNPEM